MHAMQVMYASAGDKLAIYTRSEARDLTLTQHVPVVDDVRAFCLSPSLHHMHVATAEGDAVTLEVDKSIRAVKLGIAIPVPLPISPCYMTTDRSGRLGARGGHSTDGWAK